MNINTHFQVGQVIFVLENNVPVKYVVKHIGVIEYCTGTKPSITYYLERHDHFEPKKDSYGHSIREGQMRIGENHFDSLAACKKYLVNSIMDMEE